MNYWQDKVVLITGASSGIGFAITEHALAHGANVCVFCRSETEQLQALRQSSLFIHLGDVSSLKDIQDWVESVSTRFSHIDLVINNAGAMYYADCKQADYEQMVRMINTNCLGYVNLCHALLPFVSKQDYCHWINMTSDAGKQPYPGLAVYSGSKAFIEFCSRAMRQELIQDNVKITNIQPGNVKTKLHSLSTDKKALKAYGTEDKGQYLTVKDIVRAIDYAVSMPQSVAVNEILVQPLSEST